MRAAPSDTIPPTASVAEGKLVCALTGEVHTAPGRFVVKRQHGRFAVGDTILVYTYRGEGWFLVEFEGQRFEENLEFSPWGGSMGSRCEVGAQCWGTLQEPLDFDWWIRVDDLAGTLGWVRGTGDFDIRIVTAADPSFFAECGRRRDAVR